MRNIASYLKHFGILGSLIATLFGISAPASATENGGSTWPLGLENHMVAALPPPGFYGMVFLTDYRANTLKDAGGNDVPVDFKVRADVVAPRLVWVTNQTILGGQLAFHGVMPLVNLQVNVAGQSQTKSGLGDMVFGPVLGFHHSTYLHSVAVLDVTLPTGQYSKGDLANIGRNYWSIRPIYAVTYCDPNGLNADALLLYNYNLKNHATGYKSGQEINIDYSLGWGVGKGLVLGVGGYLYKQITDDELNGNSIGNRGRAFAVGPNIKYDSGKGWFVSVKWQKEMAVRNRPQGSAFWVKAVFPL